MIVVEDDYDVNKRSKKDLPLERSKEAKTNLDYGFILFGAIFTNALMTQ